MEKVEEKEDFKEEKQKNPPAEPEQTDAKESGQQEAVSPEEASEITLPKEEFQALVSRLNELEELKDKLTRSAADFENAKKRLARERDEYLKFGHENLIRGLLPVLDNLERALSHAKGAGQANSARPEAEQNDKGLLAGIQMIYKQLLDILKNQGLTRIESLAQPFDPHKHEALLHVPGEGKEDEVVEEIEAGYMLHDRLLRAAKVKVRSAPSSSGEEG